MGSNTSCYTNTDFETVINLQEPYTNTKDYIVYTKDQHHIPGIRAFAHHIIKNAIHSLRWHYHDSCFEFTIVIKGTISSSTHDSTYSFSSGDVMISFPNEVHGTNNVPIPLGELYYFQLDISDPKTFLFMNEAAAADTISKLITLPNHVVHAKSAEIHPLIRHAFHLTQTGNSPLYIASYLQLFLQIVIASAQKEQLHRLSPDIGRTLDYIMENITAELPLEELAALANLSCSQYKHKFQKQMSISPRRFINQQKIEYSKHLLLEGMSVTDVSMLLGFNTSSYFSTAFKKYTFHTPIEYIKATQKGLSF